MRDHFCIGLRQEFCTGGFKLTAQFAEVLDDAVVDDRDALSGVRVRVVLIRLAVGRPAGVADADLAIERMRTQARFEIAKFTLGALARDVSAFERGNARGIVAAIFKTLERVDHLAGDRLAPDNAYNPTHPSDSPLPIR